MVFGNLFGGGKKKRQQKLAEYTEAWLDSLEPMWEDAVLTIYKDPNLDSVFKDVIFRALKLGKLEEARELVRTSLPQMTAASRERLKHAGQASYWTNIKTLEKSGMILPDNNSRPPIDGVQLARIPSGGPEEDDLGTPLWFHGDGHLLTVAPTGAGKGQRFIIPALLEFEGPVVVLDPKGENYRDTAWRRDMFGQVFKWSPSEDDSDCYNPLYEVKTWDDARLLADLLIVSQSKDPFWDNAAKDLLTGLIFYVIRTKPPEQQNMREVCRALAGSADEHKNMIDTLQSSDEERLRELGNIIEEQSEGLRTSIYTTLRTQLEVWRSDNIVRTTSSSTPNFSPGRILTSDNTGVTFAALAGRRPGHFTFDTGKFVKGSAGSVYLIVPPEEIGTLQSVLRVILGQFLNGAIKIRPTLEAENANVEDLPESYPDWPIMFLFDELPQLGYMGIVENAVAITRSYKIRLWLFTQDIAQLKEIYPKWESLMANCRSQIFFRPNDMATAEYVANRLGRRKDLWGGEDWVASPQQLMGPDFREDCVIFQDGLTIRARMFKPVYADKHFQEELENLKAKYGTDIVRASPAEIPRSDEEILEELKRAFGDLDEDVPTEEPPAPTAETVELPTEDAFADDEEFQREMAEARRRAEKRLRAKKEAPQPPDFD